MPTAARLIAAIFMGIAGVIVIIVSVNEYPDAAYDQFPMAVTAAVIGLVVGWRGLGSKIGVEEVKATSLGLRAGVSAFFWTLFMFGLWRMIQGIMKHEFYQPLSAIMALLWEMIRIGKLAVMNMPVLITIIILSWMAGIVTKNAWLKWDQSRDLEIHR